jgi:ferredoxin--NADP+ reductase
MVAPEAFILSFERTFDFLPGQVIGLSLSEGDQPRLYSIASGNREKLVRILYTVKAFGKLTPDLALLKTGDTILVAPPFGKFVCDEQPAVWVATGTGIAPFASMFFSGLGENKILIQGNRFAGGLYFMEHFRQSMGTRYFPTCTREKTEGIFYGRVLKFIEEWPDFNVSLNYYLCGSAEMVVDVRDLLIEKGVPFEKVIAEIFF